MRYIVLIIGLLVSSTTYAASYEPKIVDDFYFHKKGEEKVYKLKRPFFSRLEMVLYGKDCELPVTLSENPFQWKVKAQIIDNGKVIEETYIKERAWWFQEGNTKCYKSISFEHFKSLSYKILPKAISIKVLVEEIDLRYSTENNKLSIGFRRSPVP